MLIGREVQIIGQGGEIVRVGAVGKGQEGIGKRGVLVLGWLPAYRNEWFLKNPDTFDFLGRWLNGETGKLRDRAGWRICQYDICQ